MTNRSIFHLLLLCAITGSFFAAQKQENLSTPVKAHIFFDLGGVLLGSDMVRSVWELGPKTVFSYWLRKGFSHQQVVKTFYDTLDRVSHTNRNDLNIRDDKYNLMPHLMCQWLKGAQEPTEILATVTTAIEDHPEWFEHTAEQMLMKKMARLVFDPEIFCKTRSCYQETINLICECKKAGHHLHVLSNFDSTSFKLLAERFPEIFELFDSIILSGDMKMAKPEDDLFTYLTNHYPAHQSILIDDQLENITVAQAHGMQAIWCLKNGHGPTIDLVRLRLEKSLKVIVH